MLTRDQALALLDQQGFENGLLHHALETEAVMRTLAARLGVDQELWGLTGLLHDLDFPQTKDDPARHGLVAAQELEGRLPEEGLQAIRAHNSEMNGTEATTIFDYALRCGETVTGLISANALVRPQGVQGMKPKSLKKKMKDKSFAANVNRERLQECERIGLDLNEFLQLAIAAFETIAPEVGLEPTPTSSS
jgi:hypothetical protein